MRTSATLSFLVLSVVLPACDDHEIAGRYQLISVGGDDLPAPVYPQSTARTTGGSVEFAADTLYQHETIVSRTFGQEVEHHHFSGARYEIDGNVVRTYPEGTDPVPDDTFVWCETGGVFRIEDGGDQLRMIDVVSAGACGQPTAEVVERVYRRD